MPNWPLWKHWRRTKTPTKRSDSSGAKKNFFFTVYCPSLHIGKEYNKVKGMMMVSMHFSLSLGSREYIAFYLYIASFLFFILTSAVFFFFTIKCTYLYVQCQCTMSVLLPFTQLANAEPLRGAFLTRPTSSSWAVLELHNHHVSTTTLLLII